MRSIALHGELHRLASRTSILFTPRDGRGGRGQGQGHGAQAPPSSFSLPPSPPSTPVRPHTAPSLCFSLRHHLVATTSTSAVAVCIRPVTAHNAFDHLHLLSFSFLPVRVPRPTLSFELSEVRPGLRFGLLGIYVGRNLGVAVGIGTVLVNARCWHYCRLSQR